MNLTVTAAGRGIKGFDPTQAVAIVSSVSYAGVLVGPPLFGGLSVALGELRWSILLDGLIMTFIFFLARWLPNRVEAVLNEDTDMGEVHTTV
jgi:MFS family permease